MNPEHRKQRALPEYEAHVYQAPTRELRYALSFDSNADRALFLKAALQDAQPEETGKQYAISALNSAKVKGYCRCSTEPSVNDFGDKTTLHLCEICRALASLGADYIIPAKTGSSHDDL